MRKYIQIEIEVNSQPEKDILIAELSELGFEGFEEERTSLKAFINEKQFREADLQSLLQKTGMTYSLSIIEDKNWNAIWEAGFEPVVVGSFCAVRAHFHQPVAGVQHEIIITPKMSFGTGHHATTFMMMEEMQQIDFKEKSVFDFGTGTGVLAILAEQMGASKVEAADNDEWSIENAKENLLRNKSKTVQVINMDKITAARIYDVILANINKHVIMQQMKGISGAVSENGFVLFSGLLNEDEKEINQLASENGLRLINKKEKHNWICLRYVSKS
jgi:ribosomal protein L11 methyltransferase